MDELLKVLAALLGVEAKRDAVKSAVSDLTAQMADPAAAPPPDGSAPVDLPALLQVLGLPEDADSEAVIAALQSLLATLQPAAAPVDAAMSAKKPDAAAIKSAASWLADHAPLPGAVVPYHTAGGDSESSAAPGQKSTHFGSVNYNRGAKLPGLAELVLGIVGKKSVSAMKAMGYSIGPNGGYWTRQEVAAEMIELFRANTVIDKLGATYVPMNGIETLSYRKQLTGARATYRGEHQSVTESNPTFGVVNLQLKELIAPLRVSKRLLNNSVTNLETMLRKDLQIGLELRADKAALLGTGGIPNETGASGAEPRGILYTTGVTSTSLGTNGAIPTIKDFTDGWGRIEDADVPVSSSWGIAYSPRTKRTMDNLTDTTGQLLPRARWTQGYKDVATTQISNALTVGSNSSCSLVFLGAWEYLIVGLGQNVEIIVDESKYVAEGDIFIQAEMMHDCGVAQAAAFQVLTGVKA